MPNDSSSPRGETQHSPDQSDRTCKTCSRWDRLSDSYDVEVIKDFLGAGSTEDPTSWGYCDLRWQDYPNGLVIVHEVGCQGMDLRTRHDFGCNQWVENLEL